MARRTAPPRVADLEILEDEQDMARPNEAEEAQGAAVQAWGRLRQTVALRIFASSQDELLVFDPVYTLNHVHDM